MRNHSRSICWRTDLRVNIGSDRLHIILKKLTGTTPHNRQHWKLANADWGAVTSLCHENLNHDGLADLSDPVEGFCSSLLSIAYKTIPTTSSSPKKNTANHGLITNVKRQSLNVIKLCRRAQARRTLLVSRTFACNVQKLDEQSTRASELAGGFA